MYAYSQSVTVDNGFGYNESIQNIQCKNPVERRYVELNTGSLKTDEELTKISRSIFGPVHSLPCEDVKVLCGYFECDMKYHFNISSETILDSPNECVWFEFNTATQMICDGLCSNFTGYTHTIRIDIKIDFSQSITNKTDLCQNFFGNINSTQKSVGTVDRIYHDALRIYFRSNYEWKRYVKSPPNTSFIINNGFKYYLLCNETIAESKLAYLSITFQIRDKDNNIKKIENNYKEGSEFYYHSYSLLTNYFGDANIIITTEVIHNVIENIIPRTWFEEVLIEYFSVPYSLIWMAIYLIIGFIGYLHEKYATKQCFIFCCNKQYVFHPVDQVKFQQITAYCTRVINNFAALYFIYKLIDILGINDFNNLVFAFNILFLIILIICAVSSYIINISIIIEPLQLNRFYEIWMYSNRAKVWTYFLLSGSVQKTHLFVSSRLLGLSSFLCPLSIYDRRILYDIEIKYVLPRIVLELVFQSASTIIITANTKYDTGFTYSALVSIVLSILNVIEIFLEYKWQQAHNYQTTEFGVTFTINGNNINHNVNIENKMYYFGHINNEIVPAIYGRHSAEFYHVELDIHKKAIIYYGIKQVTNDENQNNGTDLNLFERDIKYKNIRNSFERLFGFQTSQQNPEKHLLRLELGKNNVIEDQIRLSDEEKVEEKKETTIDKLWEGVSDDITSLTKQSNQIPQYGTNYNSFSSATSSEDLWNTTDDHETDKCNVCQILKDCVCRKRQNEEMLFREEKIKTQNGIFSGWFNDESITSSIYSGKM